MSSTRTSRLFLRRAGSPMCAAALLAGVGGLAACEAYPSVKELPVDCSIESQYDYDTPINVSSFFGAGDPFCSASVINTVEPLSGDGVCSRKTALHLTAKGCNDWGGLFGYISFGPRNASAFEGLSFWGRAAGNTGRAFTIVLDDKNTSTTATDRNCMDYGADAGVAGQPPGTTVDPNGNVISGAPNFQPPPDACGNGYNAVVTITSQSWRHYTIPFSRFAQDPRPNRVPNAVFTEAGNVPGNGLLTSDLWGFTIRMPKEAQMDLWLEHLSFYRRKASDAGATD